jgi:hypothetical protein
MCGSFPSRHFCYASRCTDRQISLGVWHDNRATIFAIFVMRTTNRNTLESIFEKALYYLATISFHVYIYTHNTFNVK